MQLVDTAQNTTPATSDEWIRDGEGAFRRIGDVNILRVKGSSYEMGRQHGALLKDQIAAGPLPYFSGMVLKLVGRGMLGPFSPLILTGIQRTLGRNIWKHVTPEAKELLFGMADGAGLDRQQVIDGCTMPDAIMWVVAHFNKLTGPGPAVAHRMAMEMGCTSAVAWGQGTQDGALLHARNFDYHGVGCWPKTKTVIFREPDHGMKHVSVAAAGVPMGGITAMNEAGLTLTVHQHMFTDGTRLGGVPISLVGDLVMREAHNLDEAERILDAHTPIGCWTYVITDGKTREVLCYEENPDRSIARRYKDEEQFAYANIYFDEALGETEVNLYGSYWRHNRGRQDRAQAMLQENFGSLTPQHMAEILGDTGSTECRVRDAIAMVMTTGSVVFNPEAQTLWVGTGETPTSHGEFLPFSLTTQDHAPELPALHVGDDISTPDKEAFECFRKAYCAYVDDYDVWATQRHAEEATKLAPGQSLYHYLHGLLNLKLNHPLMAEKAFSKAIELGHPDQERKAAFHLWRGRAYDLMGDREHASKDYRESLAYHADPPVYRAARQGLKRPFTSRKAHNVHVDMALIDVVSP